jgi:hypothetical protein
MQAFNQLSFVLFLHLMIRQDNQHQLHLAHNAAPTTKPMLQPCKAILILGPVTSMKRLGQEIISLCRKN